MSRIFRKNVFTGKLEEDFIGDVAASFEVVNAASRKKTENLVDAKRLDKDPYNTGKDYVSKAMSIAPEKCTEERISRENAEAQNRGTGAYYTPDGRCHLPTRGVRYREMERKDRQDNDAGYGDASGRS